MLKMINSKRELDFYIKADNMMNCGIFNRTFVQRIRQMILPLPQDKIMLFLRLMRKSSYYRHRGGG